MSIISKLKERAGPRVQFRVIDRVSSGSPARLRLSAPGLAAFNVPGAANLLARRHFPFAKSHPVLTRVAEGETEVILVPMVEDLDLLIAELAGCGLTATRHEPPATVDVKALRERTGLTQEAFALRFGLDLSTLRNWEQGRSAPDMASRTLLSLIARAPDEVEALLQAS